MRAFRHGEILFVKTFKKNFPKDLKEVNQKEFLKGSHGNPHMFDNGKLYLKNVDDFIFGYFQAKNTTLKHLEHGSGSGKTKTAKLPDGFYELRRQVEFVNDSMKPVVD